MPNLEVLLLSSFPEISFHHQIVLLTFETDLVDELYGSLQSAHAIERLNILFFGHSENRDCRYQKALVYHTHRLVVPGQLALNTLRIPRTLAVDSQI